MPERTSPSPFYLEGGPIGALLIHGYTGSPAEMRPIADYLHARGLTISAPLLPGHGTTPEALNRVAWTDWTASVEQALRQLHDRCGTVTVAGLSLGALLTLYLAANHPALLAAVVYSPPLKVANRLARLVPLGKYLIRLIPKPSPNFTDPDASARTWSYDRYPVVGAHEVGKLIREVSLLLPRVACPLLIVHSSLDKDIRPQSAQFVYDQVGSEDKQLLILENSGHGLTVDSEWQMVAEKTYRFMASHARRWATEARSI